MTWFIRLDLVLLNVFSNLVDSGYSKDIQIQVEVQNHGQSNLI